MLLYAGSSHAADKAKHQITGLFSRDREQDLRDVVQTIPEIKLVSIEFKTAEATFEYDVATVFPNAAPEQIVERFDNLLRNASRHTFGVKPLCTTPRDKLTFIEIPVAGLDCKGCSFGAYDAIYRIDGVEQATASFKDGLVTAWIHPDRTDRAKLEEALKQRGVTLVAP
jgi:hypothetical protein